MVLFFVLQLLKIVLLTENDINTLNFCILKCYSPEFQFSVSGSEFSVSGMRFFKNYKKMETPSFKEDHISQIPALQMLVNLGYTYLSPAEADRQRGGKNISNTVFHITDEFSVMRINSKAQYRPHFVLCLKAPADTTIEKVKAKIRKYTPSNIKAVYIRFDNWLS
jgi:hypothetical protein